MSGLQTAHQSVIGESLGVGFQNFIKQTSLISVPYSTIVGRAQIPDIASDMRASFGIERIQTQSIVLLQNEFGASGEPVYGVVNDDRGLIRCVGQFLNRIQSYGSNVSSEYDNDYVEIVFYGTGINGLLSADAAASPDVRVTVDGGSESANIMPNHSNILLGRNYSPNHVISLISGLTLGLHTVKIRFVNSYSVVRVRVSGFEILNSNATGLININPGIAYIKGEKQVNSLARSIAYNKDQAGNTIVTGTKGGRIVRAITANDTISTYWQAVDASVAYGNSASHTNEEVARIYMPREFGAGRYANQDDFSLITTARAAAFTLDDGVTTLASGSAASYILGTNPEGVMIWTNANTLSFTFVGCGLDLLMYDTATGSNGATDYQYSIDGASYTNWFSATGSTALRVQKIVSGLTYGTHTFTILRNAYTAFGLLIVAFKVYQPKKPSLPSESVEICDYNVMANYVANTVAGLNTIGTGLLRKHGAREMVYVGAPWTLMFSYGYIGGYEFYSNLNTSYVAYTFFGTGFELRGLTLATGSSNNSVTIDSLAATTANFPSLTSSVYGGYAFSSGTLNIYSGSSIYGSGLSIKGLPLGKHTVVFTNNTSNFLQIEAIDIITPIHSYKSNIYADIQNTLPVGSNSLMDTRKTTIVKDSLLGQKAWAQAVGVTADPATSSTVPIPLPDMSVTIKTSGGPLQIAYNSPYQSTSIGYTAWTQVYVDGVAVGTKKGATNYVSNNVFWSGDNMIVPVSTGVHKVDIYWWIADVISIRSYATLRNLTVREI